MSSLVLWDEFCTEEKWCSFVCCGSGNMASESEIISTYPEPPAHYKFVEEFGPPPVPEIDAVRSSFVFDRLLYSVRQFRVTAFLTSEDLPQRI